MLNDSDVQVRILKHIARQEWTDPEQPAPASLTQKAIAGGVGYTKAWVSEQLRMMMKEGLVKKRMWRIRGGKRRVMVYLLTDKGRIIANLMITNVMK